MTGPGTYVAGRSSPPLAAPAPVGAAATPAKIDDAAGSVLGGTAAAAAAQQSGENFPVALRLLPRRPREELARIYAYARFVDDLGDEAPGDRHALLDAVEADVRAIPSGRCTLAPVAALAPVVRGHALSLGPLLDLVEANRVDQRVARYETFGDLLDYCALSANPVGRLVLGIADVDSPIAQLRSDSVCSALQVLEHCQDVGEDARAGRVYLPADDLAAAGVADADLLAAATSPALRGVVADQVDRAAELLDPGRALVRQLHGWAAVAVAGFVAGGVATVAALRAARYDVLNGVVKPGRLRTAGEALRLVTGR